MSELSTTVDDSDPHRRPRVLLRSLWQSVNIGDVAHAPGSLRAFQRFAPDAELALWATDVPPRERELMQRFLPDVQIVEGRLDEEGRPSTEALSEAFAWADLLVHGPAAGPSAAEQLDRWHELTGKPYGFLGITVDPVSPPSWGRLSELRAMVESLPSTYLDAKLRGILDRAAFVFCRDRISLGHLRRSGVSSPVLEFGPDASFSYDLRDDDAAGAMLAEYGLTAGEFVCVVARDRYTPYFRIRNFEPGKEEIRREAVNVAWRQFDNGVLVDIITAWVRSSGQKVLVCPEMVYAVELAKTEIIDRLPADVAGSVVWLPRYWGLAEAAAVYARAAAVVSVECHSPILAVAAGVPAMYIRQPTDTVKGQMYDDLGMSVGVTEIEDDAAARTLEFLDRATADPAAARQVCVDGLANADAALQQMVVTAMSATGCRG